jgi:ABC-type transport system involved in multi-copper enzyme maturation permease subunit
MRMNTVFALAGVVLKEMYRRKDFYVLFVLTAVITLLMASMNFFNDSHIVRYIKGICLLLIWISALVMAVGTGARQLYAERESRTIFPLLAKPVTRAQVVVGKFMGCWLACGAALLFFYVFFAVISGSKESSWPVLMYFQAAWLQWCMLGVVLALVLLGSVLFTAPSSNATICFVIIGGILLLGGHLNKLALREPEPLRTLFYGVYFVIPHLEWFDIRDFVVYDHPLVQWGYWALATLYAAAYAAVLLFATWLVFRRKPLNL